MGRISRYGADATVELSDKLLGTDAGGLTKNYTVDSLGTFIAATHGSEGYINIAFNTTTGIITMTEVDGGTDTIDLGIGTGDTPSFAGMNLTGDLTVPDNTKLKIGTDGDLTIWHNTDGGHSYITSNGTGNLVLESLDDAVTITSATSKAVYLYPGGQNGIRTFHGGASELYYANVKRFNTESTGATVTGALTVTTDADITGSAKVTQNLRRTVTTASESSGTHTITLVDNDNFNIAVTNAATTIALVVATENIGQSGMITITNPASVGSLSFVALPSYMLTPEGATINFVTTANAVSIISYYVLATDKVLVNYVGNFA